MQGMHLYKPVLIYLGSKVQKTLVTRTLKKNETVRDQLNIQFAIVDNW